MKRIIIASCMLLAICSIHAQEHFAIDGKLNDLKDDATIYLAYYIGNDLYRDSATAKDHHFHFAGTVNRAVRAGLSLSVRGTDRRSFYLEPGNIEITGVNLETAAVKGGERQADLNELNALLVDIRDRVATLEKRISATKLNERAELFPQLHALKMEEYIIMNQFRIAHPDSYISLDMLVDSSNPIYDLGGFIAKFDSLSSRMKGSIDGKMLSSMLTKATETGVGSRAKEISMKYPDGRPFKLSSLRGEYVLIDFWASWCGGCRAQIPDFKKTYAAFKDKKFEIVAVSLDHVKKSWVDAIREDGASWIQVSDLQKENAAAKAYAVRGVPQNFLIDPTGIIIGRNMTVEALNRKLKEITGQ